VSICKIYTEIAAQRRRGVGCLLIYKYDKIRHTAALVAREAATIVPGDDWRISCPPDQTTTSPGCSALWQDPGDQDL